MSEQKIIENLTEMLSDSTAYGLPKIFRSKRLVLKIFWFVFFLMGFVTSTWFIWDAVNSYFKYEVITKIERVYQQPMPFPTVSFCPYIEKALDDKPLGSFIQECWHNLDRDCQYNPENYFESFRTHRGVCYRFNSGKNMSGHSIPIHNSTVGGRDDSFRLKVNINSTLYVWIHDVSSPPKFEYKYNHLGNTNFASKNAATHFVINKIVEENLGLPYSECYKDVHTFDQNKTIINFIKWHNETYKQTNCLVYCYDLNYINTNPCNCTNTSLGNVWSDCFDKHEKKNQTGCTYQNKLSFFKESVLEKCQSYCPLECDSVSYSVAEKSFSVVDTSTSLYIYYESLKYTLLSQVPKTEGFDLVSNIGGIFGSFIGMSFVSLFELGELIIEFFYIFCEKKRKNDDQMKKENPQQEPADLEALLRGNSSLTNTSSQLEDLRKIHFAISELQQRIKQIEAEKSFQNESN